MFGKEYFRCFCTHTLLFAAYVRNMLNRSRGENHGEGIILRSIKPDTLSIVEYKYLDHWVRIQLNNSRLNFGL